MLSTYAKILWNPTTSTPYSISRLSLSNSSQTSRRTKPVSVKIFTQPQMSAANIPWQERPAGNSDVVWRYNRNPIIPRNPIPRANSTFNSAVVPYQGQFAGVFRIDDIRRVMDLHVGHSLDGINWQIEPETIQFRCDDARSCPFPIPLRSARCLAGRPLLCHLVQRLPWSNHWCRLHARFQDVIPDR